MKSIGLSLYKEQVFFWGLNEDIGRPSMKEGSAVNDVNCLKDFGF